jgi:hypothetical protein
MAIGRQALRIGTVWRIHWRGKDLEQPQIKQLIKIRAAGNYFSARLSVEESHTLGTIGASPRVHFAYAAQEADPSHVAG